MRCRLQRAKNALDEERATLNRTELENAARPGLARRLAAIFYDTWLVAGIWLLGATVDTLIQAGMGLGEHRQSLPLQVFLVATPYLFFGWFWTHGGQTLGMRAWRLRLLSDNGQPVSWRQVVIRVSVALVSMLALGLGYLWALFHPDRQCWHDIASGTRLVILSKEKRS